MHISLGFLYTISLKRTDDQSCSDLYHSLSLTRDLNNQFHVFTHIFSVCPQPHPTVFSDTLDSCVDTHSVSDGNVFLKESYCSDICCHGGTQCPVSVEQVTALEATTCAFHSTKCPERQLHGDRGVQTAQWNLTNEEYCRHCNHTRCHRGSLPGVQSLKIATYNMWNLNSLEWESYSERLGRLGKVWYTHVSCTISPPHSSLPTLFTFSKSLHDCIWRAYWPWLITNPVCW